MPDESWRWESWLESLIFLAALMMGWNQMHCKLFHVLQIWEWGWSRLCDISAICRNQQHMVHKCCILSTEVCYLGDLEKEINMLKGKAIEPRKPEKVVGQLDNHNVVDMLRQSCWKTHQICRAKEKKVFNFLKRHSLCVHVMECKHPVTTRLIKCYRVKKAICNPY